MPINLIFENPLLAYIILIGREFGNLRKWDLY